jgi:hypothetical protein
VWRIEKDTLIREETLTAKQPVNIRRWWLAVPTTYANVETRTVENVRADLFNSDEGSLEVKMLASNFPMTTHIFATGNSPLGRGVHGAIPLHLVFESTNLGVVQANKQLNCRLALTVGSNSSTH